MAGASARVRRAVGFRLQKRPEKSSRQYARPGIDKSVDAQLLGRAGECAFCCFLNLDPATSLDWSANLDSGWDMVVRGRRIDVKSSGTEYLMWPVTKNGFLQQCEAHLFVLVSRLEEDLFEIGGWITVANFIANHHTARPPAFMDEGTKYLHKSELMDFSEATRAGHPNGFVGYADDGTFVHFCHCGKAASFGSNVALRQDKLGTWLCGEHWRENNPCQTR